MLIKFSKRNWDYFHFQGKVMPFLWLIREKNEKCIFLNLLSRLKNNEI